MAEGNLGLDPEVGAVAVGFDREFSYDKLVRAATYLTNPDCLFLATNTDEKYLVTGTPLYLPGECVNILTYLHTEFELKSSCYNVCFYF